MTVSAIPNPIQSSAGFAERFVNGTTATERARDASPSEGTADADCAEADPTAWGTMTVMTQTASATTPLRASDRCHVH